jgi:hypothetical protein
MDSVSYIYNDKDNHGDQDGYVHAHGNQYMDSVTYSHGNPHSHGDAYSHLHPYGNGHNDSHAR